MRVARHPAAYLQIPADCGPAGWANQRYALYDAIRRRGWPEPEVYFDEDIPGPGGNPGLALDTLTAAIGAGRHDALLLAGTGTIMRRSPADLMRLLRSCTRSGVAVEYLTPPAPPRGPI